MLPCGHRVLWLQGQMVLAGGSPEAPWLWACMLLPFPGAASSLVGGGTRAVMERTSAWCFGDAGMSQTGPVLRGPHGSFLGETERNKLMTTAQCGQAEKGQAPR